MLQRESKMLQITKRYSNTNTSLEHSIEHQNRITREDAIATIFRRCKFAMEEQLVAIDMFLGATKILRPVQWHVGFDNGTHTYDTFFHEGPLIVTQLSFDPRRRRRKPKHIIPVTRGDAVILPSSDHPGTTRDMSVQECCTPLCLTPNLISSGMMRVFRIEGK
jgi:hypothetical protein